MPYQMYSVEEVPPVMEVATSHVDKEDATVTGPVTPVSSRTVKSPTWRVPPDPNVWVKVADKVIVGVLFTRAIGSVTLDVVKLIGTACV